MWRALVLLALVGCGTGEVTAEGSVDENGCPTQLSDLNGTATDDGDWCHQGSAFIEVTGGTFRGKPFQWDGTSTYHPVTDTCEMALTIGFDNGCDDVYRLEMPAQQ